LKIIYIGFVFILFSCIERESGTNNKVLIRIKKYPKTLNYLLSTSSIEIFIESKIFNKLYSYGQGGVLDPLLVNDSPAIIKKDGQTEFSFEIRANAIWGNKKHITGEDVSFSLKVFKLPVSKNIGAKIYLERVKNIIVDSINSKKIKIYAKGSIRDITTLVGDFDILQKSKYDSLGLLDHITFEDIENNPDKVASDEKVKQFIDAFLKDNFKFKGEYLTGSGPYEIADMETGKFVKLKKKKNWWGESLAGKLPQFHAYPEEIIYVCLPEPLVAIQALKNGSIDVMNDIPTNEFVQLKKDKVFLKNYNLYSPLKYKFTYIGFNSRIKYLDNIKIREALSYLVKPEDMIKVVEGGYGQKTIGPINPAKSYYYNEKISPNTYDPNLAQQIFLTNGFKLIENKLINQETNQPLAFEVSYRQNPGYESIAVILKQEAANIGIRLKLKQYEGRTMSKIARNHAFEIVIGAFNGNPNSLNFSGLFSQEAKKIGGMNFTGFGNNKSDSIIHAANYAKDSTSKKAALYAFQEALHEETTMLFLYFSKNKIAVNKKFDNLKISAIKPGYDVTSFILKSSEKSN
jgi:peptide/nickel transport system substrate-binding protein